MFLRKTDTVPEPPSGPSVFNVKDYDAIGDGNTNDTLAIRAALVEAESYSVTNGSATVYFPEGTYNIAPRGVSDVGGSDQAQPWPTGFLFPAGIRIKGNNIKFLGDGPTRSIISTYTYYMGHPLYNWDVIGDGGTGQDRKIWRGAALTFDEQNIQNFILENLRITGNLSHTDESFSGGKPYPCTCANNIFTSSNHGLTNGTLIRFGNTRPSPLGYSSDKGYYVANVTTHTFQIEDSPGSGIITGISDKGETFYATDGDGWDLTHNALRCGARAYSNVTIKNCILDRFRGEIIHGGGDSCGTVNIENSIIEQSNGSMISVPSVFATASIFRDARSCFENFSRSENHSNIIDGCTIETTMGIDGTEGITIIGIPVSTTRISNCTFNPGYGASIYLGEAGSNAIIENNVFYSSGTPISFTRVNVYPNDPIEWRGYDNITIRNNNFYPTVSNNERVIYIQNLGGTRKNFKVENNVAHSYQSNKFSFFIKEVSSYPVELSDRTGSFYTDNILDTLSIMTVPDSYISNSPRDFWINNTFMNVTKGSSTNIFSWYAGQTMIAYPMINDIIHEFYSGRDSANVALYPNIPFRITNTIYPNGWSFILKFKTDWGGTASLLAETDYNRFESDIILQNNETLNLIMVDGKWEINS